MDSFIANSNYFIEYIFHKVWNDMQIVGLVASKKMLLGNH